MAHRVMVMKDSRIVESGTLDEVIGQPKSDYTRALFAAAFRHESTDDSSVAT